MKEINDLSQIPDIKNISEKIETLKKSVIKYKTEEVLSKILNCIDLTSLNEYDTIKDIENFTKKVNNFVNTFPNSKNVAAICVYPSLVSVVKENLKDESIKIASVSAGFPSSQTFLSVKVAETELAIHKGANEIDIVISIGHFLEKNYKRVGAEISIIKETINNNKLKVILETGDLQTTENIYTASMIAMESGADFIKTSTGKTKISASPEAVFTMCSAIKNYYDKTGRKVGIKPSGGISTSEEAILYYLIVEDILGKEWLNNKLFRFGASKLANNILTDINQINGNNTVVNYF